MKHFHHFFRKIALFLLLITIGTVVYSAQSSSPFLASSTHFQPNELVENQANQMSHHAHRALSKGTSIFLPMIATPGTPSEPEPPTFEQQVLTIVNQERAAAGCNPLTFNDKLNAAAKVHTTDMAVNDFISHTGSDGSSAGDRIESAGYSWWTWGENIAAGYLTPTSVMNGWMNSAGHKANILNCNFTEIGIAYVYLEYDVGQINYHHYWTQDFGKPR